MVRAVVRVDYDIGSTLTNALDELKVVRKNLVIDDIMAYYFNSVVGSDRIHNFYNFVT